MSEMKAAQEKPNYFLISFVSITIIELIMHLVFNLKMLEFYAPQGWTPDKGSSFVSVIMSSFKTLPINYHFIFGLCIGLLYYRRKVKKKHIWFVAAWLFLSKNIYVCVLTLSPLMIGTGLLITLKLLPLIYIPLIAGLILAKLLNKPGVGISHIA